MNKDRGATLLEVLVAMAIGAILMTALLSILLQGGRLLTRMSAVTTMRSAATVSLYRMAQEFKRSSWGTATVVAPTSSVPFTALAFRTADASQTEAFVPSGVFIVYYLPQPAAGATTSSLMRKVWPFNTTTTPDPVKVAPDPITNNLHLQPADVAAIAGTTNGSEQVLVQNVSSWTLTPSTFPIQISSGETPPSPLLTMDLACLQPINPPDAIRGAWHTAVLPRNP